MLKKLLHYDLKWCIKVVIVYYILGLIFSVIGRLLEFTPDTTFFEIITGISKGIGLSLVISGIVNCVIRMWVRMVINMYKDESYLTHTLPINIKTHFLSKVLATIIMVTLSIVILLISLIIMYLNEDTTEVLKQTLNIISTSFGGSITLLIMLMVLTVFLEIIFIVMVGFFGIVLGHRFNNKKILKSLLIGGGAYFGCNAITSVLIVLGAIFSTDLYNMLFSSSTAVQYNFICILIAITCAIYAIYNTLLYLFINKNLEKGINVD